MATSIRNASSLSPDWLEVQYNNRKRVPDTPELLARWGAESAAARASLSGRCGIAYGSYGERLDVFAPSGAGGGLAPVLVFIHGGYWRSLSKEDHSFVAPAFTQAGVCVVVPDYTLCPKVTIPTIAEQMAQAVAWVYDHIAEFGGDRRRIVVAGHSAGGHLTAMLMGCRWSQVAAHLPSDVVSSGLAISGLYDLAPLQNVPFLKDDLRITGQHIHQASPLHWSVPEQGELHLAVGGDESEEFLRHQAALAQAWGEQRVPTAKVVQGMHHFNIMDDFASPTGQLHGLARNLLGLPVA
jgi:arylformamidase